MPKKIRTQNIGSVWDVIAHASMAHCKQGNLDSDWAVELTGIFPLYKFNTSVRCNGNLNIRNASTNDARSREVAQRSCSCKATYDDDNNHDKNDDHVQ